MIAALALALALATGPSWATYRIVPVAASARGVVLFRTWRELNPTGAHAPQRVAVGWLAVSAAGLWREAPHAVVDPEGSGGEDAARERLDRLRAELDAPLDWADPPASVRPLLAELGLSARDAVDPGEGKGAATWSPARTCARGSCASGVLQRTIGGLESDRRDGTAVRSAFFHAGVALFRNRHAHGLDAEHDGDEGAQFALPPNVHDTRELGPVDLGYDLADVEGIAIVRPRRPPGRASRPAPTAPP